MFGHSIPPLEHVEWNSTVYSALAFNCIVAEPMNSFI